MAKEENKMEATERGRNEFKAFKHSSSILLHLPTVWLFPVHRWHYLMMVPMKRKETDQEKHKHSQHDAAVLMFSCTR